jgi:hypothetical protein
MPLHHRTYPPLGQSDIATSRTSKSHQCFAGLFYCVRRRSRPTVMPHGPFFILKFGRRAELKLCHVWWTQIPSKYPSFLKFAKPLSKRAY